MKYLISLVTVLALAGIALGGPSDVIQSPPKSFHQMGGINGIVTDRQTMRPIANARVSAKNATNTSVVRTNANGAYQIGNIPVGKYEVSVAADGYGASDYPTPVSVQADRQTTGINFALARITVMGDPAASSQSQGKSTSPTGGISGVVTDRETKRPIPNALVTSVRATVTRETHTNANGAYVMTEMLPGEYDLEVRAAGYEPASNVEPIAVRAGQLTTGVNFQLVRMSNGTGAIDGRVTDIVTNRPIAGALVSAVPLTFDKANTGETHTGADGYYRIAGLQPGEYIVSASAAGYSPISNGSPVMVKANEVTQNVNFRLQPITTTKRVEFSTGRGAIEGTVTDLTTDQPLEGVQVVATATSALTGTAARATNSVLTNSAGYYIITNLEPGDYTVSGTRENYFPGEHRGVTAVMANRITSDVDFGLRLAGIILGQPTNGTGVIEGRVLDVGTSRPIEGATVTATRVLILGNEPPIVFSARTDAEGVYRITNLPPDDYILRATRTDYFPKDLPYIVTVKSNALVPDIDFALAASISLGVSGQTAVGMIDGRVTDASTQAPLAGVLVVAAENGSTTHIGGRAMTDIQGRYRIVDLFPTGYQVSASRDGYAPFVDPKMVQVKLGERTPDVDFSMKPSTALGH